MTDFRLDLHNADNGFRDARLKLAAALNFPARVAEYARRAGRGLPLFSPPLPEPECGPEWLPLAEDDPEPRAAEQFGDWGAA